MTLFGLTLAQLALFLGASAVVVAALYRLRQRRRTVRVSFAPLWRKVVRDHPATSLFERLRRLLSFLLQVAFVFLVICAIARPRLSTDAERERRFVIVMDASARMQALTDLTSVPGRTWFDEAKGLARKLIRRLGETDRAMIVCAGPTPEPLTAFETDRRSLFDAIRLLRSCDCRSNLADAVRFARSLVPDSAERVFVFTCSPPDASFPDVQWRRIGTPLDNLAVTRFAARTPCDSPGEYELLFEVRNFGRSEANIRLRIRAPGEGGVLVEDRPLRLAPGGGISDVIRGIARKDLRLVAELTRDDGSEFRDGLPLDNRAFAVVRAPRITRVTVVGDENFFLENVLKSDPLIRWRRVTPAGYSGDDDADVVVFDNCVPPAGADRAICINPPGEGSGEITDVFVDKLAAEHPVMRFVGRLGDLNIAKSRVLVVESGTGDVVLAECAGSPVMIARERAGRRLVTLGFDLKDSDLVLRVAFPKIFRNAIHWLVSGRATQPPPSLVTGEPVAAETPEGPARLVPERAGFREVSGRTLAVNFSDEEISDLHSAPAPGESGDPPFSFARTPVGWELWPWLVGCALALTLFEWISCHRRWTV